MFEIVIDTGGTFTDGVLFDEEGNTAVAKFLTDPEEPSKSILGCIALLGRERHLSEQALLGSTTSIVIGTTLSTNCILEGKGAKCCLICTKGFRDIYELGRRIPKADIYNLKVAPPRVLIPRYLRFGVEERIQFDGQVVTALNEEDVRAAMRRAREQNVEVPVICFLHSYINPAHEEKAAEIVGSEFPDVVVSSRILRRWIEYDRLSTATIAGYVKPVTAHFVRGLEKRLEEGGFNGTLLFITGAGGVAAPDLCIENPALLIGSGPAAAPLLGRFLAELADFENAIVCDMGGTSFDVGILPGRRIMTTTEMIIGEDKNACEAVDVTSIGAGGGSIAWIDPQGLLRVGPASAGAKPGPACYGQGGQLPTVTDADVVLGYIPADYFLGGALFLDASRAEKAIEEKIGRVLGMSTLDAAHAIAALVEANMAEKIFLDAVDKGFDPRDFTLIVGGGAGPVHGVALALRLGMKQAYIPRHAATFCAFGISLADYKYILSRFLFRREDEIEVGQLRGLFDSLEEEGASILARQGISRENRKFLRGAEMRYFGQLYDIEILLPETTTDEPFTAETLRALIEGFHKRHQEMYGWSNPAMPVLISILKLQAIAPRRPFPAVRQPPSAREPSLAFKRLRPVYFKEMGEFRQTACYDADRLTHGNVIAGPAIIEARDTSVVVPKDAELKVDACGNYSIQLMQR